MKLREIFNFILAAVVLLVLMNYFGPGALRNKIIPTVSKATPAPSTATTTDGALNAEVVGAADDSKMINPELLSGVPREVSTLAVCQKKAPIESIRIPSKVWKEILAGRQKGIVIWERGKSCFKQGQDIYLREVYTDGDSGRAYLIRHRLRGKVSRLGIIKSKNFSSLDLKGWNMRELDIQNLVNSGRIRRVRQKVPIEVALIEFQDMKMDLRQPRDLTMSAHPMGKAYSAEAALRRVERDGALLLDVRPRFWFDKKHHDRAIHYPFFVTLSEQRQDKYLSSTDLTRLGMELTGDMKKMSRNKPLIFYGLNRFETDPYNAVTFFASRGFRDIGWIPGGLGELLGYGYRPPEVGWKGVLDAEKTLEMIKAGATIADVRAEPTGGLARAVRLARDYSLFYSGDPFDRLALNRPTITKDEIEKGGFKLAVDVNTIPAGKPLILMGADSLDWRPFLVRRMLEERNLEIYWYRGGAVDWADHNMQDTRFEMREFKPLAEKLQKAGTDAIKGNYLRERNEEFQKLKKERQQVRIDRMIEQKNQRLKRKVENSEEPKEKSP